MQEALNSIIKERTHFLNNCIDAKISYNKLTIIDANNFITLLNNLISFIIHTIDYEEFIKTNLDKFKLLRKILVGDDLKFYSNNLDTNLIKTFKTSYDRIFIPMKYNQIIESKIVTDFFTQFVKGITYFKIEEQQLRLPIYHRNVSCGSKELTSEQQFIDTMFGPKKDKLIERCYLERTIYNILYNKILDSQDFGHRFEYLNISRIYQNYYPNVYIDIEIEYLIDTNYPLRIIINKLDAISKVIIETQIYTKTIDTITHIYENIIRCEKKNSVNNYVKLQTFDKEEDWQIIS